jgi:hypothetical protein
MKTRNTQTTHRLQIHTWLLALAGAILMSTSARASDNRAPEVPDTLDAGVTNKVHFHGFGVGVQIYTWNGVAWGPAVPDATLFDDDGNIVASHFIGPTWKSNSGSQVKGALAAQPVFVNSDAIPWLLLKAVSTEGPGIFADTTFIQRVNTVGGKTPRTNGIAIGDVANVPYTADYFFYRHSNTR